MKFSRGKITQEMKVVGKPDHTGTTVTFKPDPEMFETLEYNYDTLHTRMREEAFINAGLRIQTVELRPGREQEDDMCYEGGIREFVTFINRSKDPLHPDVIYMSGNREMCIRDRGNFSHAPQAAYRSIVSSLPSLIRCV